MPIPFDEVPSLAQLQFATIEELQEIKKEYKPFEKR